MSDPRCGEMNQEGDSPEASHGQASIEESNSTPKKVLQLQRSKSFEEPSRTSSRTALRSPEVKRSSLDHESFQQSLNRFINRQLCEVTRICHVRITHLETRQLSASAGYFVLAVRIRGQKVKYTLRSQPIHTSSKDKETSLDISLDLRFANEYHHNIKGKTSRLQILLQKPYRKLRSQFKTVGVAHVNMDEVLQCPVKDCIDLKAPLSKLEQLSHQEERIVARVDIQIQTEIADKPVKHIKTEPSLDDFDEVSSSTEDEDLPPIDSDHSGTESETKETTGKKLKIKAGKLLASLTESSKQWFQKFKDRHSKDTPKAAEDVDDRALEFFEDHDKNEDSDDVSDQQSDFEPILATPEEQVAALYADDDKPPPYILFADPESFRVRRLLRWYRRMKCTLSEKNVLAVQGKTAVSNAFRAIFKRSQGSSAPVRVAIAGGDHYINHILEPYLDLMSKERRGYERRLNMYIIPLGDKRSDNHVAHWVSLQDQVYQGLFFASEWHSCFERNAPVWLEAQGQRVEEVIKRYLEYATNTFNVPIGEALIDLVAQSGEKEDTAAQSSSDAHTIPFLRDVQVLTHHAASPLLVSPNVNSMDVNASKHEPPPLSLNEAKDCLSPAKPPTPSRKDMKSAIQRFREKIRKEKSDGAIPLKIDYWPVETSKKRKNQKKQIKSELHHFSAFRLIHPFQEEYSDSKEDGNMESPSSLYMRVLTTKDFEKQIKDKRSGESGAKREPGKKERLDMDPIQVNKFICSSLNYESHFSVMIDGIQWTRVNFVSVSPQWTARIKHFPVAVFASPLHDDISRSSLEDRD